MIKVMFVCHGNICRSPMAEYIFRHMLSEHPYLRDECMVCSAATSSEEIYGGIGNPVYPPAKAELERHGISCEGKRAVQVVMNDYAQYDLFVVMDENNLRNLMRIFQSDPQKKIHKLLSFVNENRDVADPWYTDRFDVAFQDISRGCEGVLLYLEKHRRELL